MKKTTSAFLMGAIFAWGLGISQMTRPPKVVGFLNLLGEWDPTLLVVLIAAVAVYYIGYRFIVPHEIRDTLERHLAGKENITAMMLFGAAVFGIGWGMIGLCPGPAIVDLFAFRLDVFIFVVGMVLGIYSAKAYIYPAQK